MLAFEVAFKYKSNLAFRSLRLKGGLHLVADPLSLPLWSFSWILIGLPNGECLLGCMLWRDFSSPWKLCYDHPSLLSSMGFQAFLLSDFATPNISRMGFLFFEAQGFNNETVKKMSTRVHEIAFESSVQLLLLRVTNIKELWFLNPLFNLELNTLAQWVSTLSPDTLYN